MIEKHAANQKGVSGPRELAKMASEFVTQVKKTAAEKSITGAEDFVKMASESLVKFSSRKNLAPAVVERIATLFNSAKVSSVLNKTAVNSRGESVELMDPAEVVSRYKAKGLKKSGGETDRSADEDDPFKNHRKQMALSIVDKDGHGMSVGGGADVGLEIFQGIRQGFLDKAASEKEPRTLADDLKECKEDELLLAKHAYKNGINDHLRKMCSIVAVSGGPDPVEFLSDVHVSRPDLIGAASSFARILTKNASASRKKIKLKERKVCSEFLRSYGGLRDHLEKVASLQRSASYLDRVDQLVKQAARGDGMPSPDQLEDEDEDTDSGSGKSKPIGSDRVLSLFNFEEDTKKPSDKSPQSGAAAQKPALAKSSPVAGSLSTHFGKIRENKPEPSRDLLDADNETRLKSTFMALLNDEALADEDPYDLEEALNTLHGVAPHLAANPTVARVVVRSMMQYDGVDPLAIKQFAESEREMLRSLETGRGNFNAAGGGGK